MQKLDSKLKMPKGKVALVATLARLQAEAPAEAPAQTPAGAEEGSGLRPAQRVGEQSGDKEEPGDKEEEAAAPVEHVAVGLVASGALDMDTDTDLDTLKVRFVIYWGGGPDAAAPHTVRPKAALQVNQLKMALRARGVRYPGGAKKAELRDLLRWALDSAAPAGDAPQPALAPAVFPETYDWDALADGQSDAESDDVEVVAEAAGSSAAAAAAADTPAATLAHDVEGADAVRPGTQQFERVATAEEAAREKALAGENRAVEHVALHDDAGVSAALAGGARGKRAAKRAAGVGLAGSLSLDDRAAAVAAAGGAAVTAPDKSDAPAAKRSKGFRARKRAD